MNASDWPKDEIQGVARSSGKPLEVSCAEAFLAAGWRAQHGPLDDLEERAAARLLNASGLAESRPLVAFDMIQRTETTPRKNKPPKDTAVTYHRPRDGDRHLFGKEVMVLVWSVTGMTDLVAALDDLFGWFRDDIRATNRATSS